MKPDFIMTRFKLNMLIDFLINALKRLSTNFSKESTSSIFRDLQKFLIIKTKLSDEMMIYNNIEIIQIFSNLITKFSQI